MYTLMELNADFREQYAINSDIAARTKSYELAARMQLSAPEAVDFSNEPEHVQELYGIGERRHRRFRPPAPAGAPPGRTRRALRPDLPRRRR